MDMSNEVNILITGVGSTTAISVIKGLKKQNQFVTNIIGTDIFSEHEIAGSKLCDKFFIVPPAIQEQEFISKLLKIVATESIDIIIPIVDTELEIIAKNKNVFKNTFVLISSFDTIITCNDKLKTYDFFNKFKIPTLKTIFLENLNDFSKQISRNGIKYPLIAKPRTGVSSRGVYEIKDFKESVLVHRIDQPIIQEKGYGEEFTIDIFGDGKQLVSAVPRRRIETRSGISYKGETVKIERLIEYATIIYNKLKFIGPANLQCFVNNDEIKFFDINPRFSGSLPLTIEAGINTTLLGIKMAMGDQLDPITDFKYVKMCRYWEEIFYYD